MADFIFVYGTLRKGKERHHLLEAARAEFVCECSVKGRVVYASPDYSGTKLIVGHPGTDEEALGELYLVRDTKILETLDAYEVPYKRRLIHPVSMPTLSAWVWI